jgi:hypothetical protein
VALTHVIVAGMSRQLALEVIAQLAMQSLPVSTSSEQSWLFCLAQLAGKGFVERLQTKPSSTSRQSHLGQLGQLLSVVCRPAPCASWAALVSVLEAECDKRQPNALICCLSGVPGVGGMTLSLCGPAFQRRANLPAREHVSALGTITRA